MPSPVLSNFLKAFSTRILLARDIFGCKKKKKNKHSGLKLYAGDAFISYKKPLSHKQGSERSERASE